jgi:hypothetical protein
MKPVAVPDPVKIVAVFTLVIQDVIPANPIVPLTVMKLTVMRVMLIVKIMSMKANAGRMLLAVEFILMTLGVFSVRRIALVIPMNLIAHRNRFL